MGKTIYQLLGQVASVANAGLINTIEERFAKQEREIDELLQIVRGAGFCLCPHCEAWGHVDCLALTTGDDDDCLALHEASDQLEDYCPGTEYCKEASLVLECCMYPAVKWERITSDGIQIMSSQKYEPVNFSNLDWAWGARKLKNTWR